MPRPPAVLQEDEHVDKMFEEAKTGGPFDYVVYLVTEMTLGKQEVRSVPR